MNLLTQLLLNPVTFAPPPPEPKKPRRGKANQHPHTAVSIYRSHLRGKGVVPGHELARVSGRSVQAVHNAMRKTLARKGLVRVHERHFGLRMFYAYEWIGQ